MDNICPLYFEDTHPAGESFDKILVFVHGNLISCRYWKPLINEMLKINPKYRCIAMDLRGFGRSQQINNVDSMHDLSEDVAHLLITKIFPELTADQMAERVYLIGWSLGGGVCMQMAVDHPDRFHKLILVGSVGVAGYPIMQEDDVGEIPEKCQTKEQLFNCKKMKVNEEMISTKNSGFWKMVFEKVLFNSGKLPEATLFDQLIQEILLQSNYSSVCWALNTFDISGGKLDLAKNIVGPVLIYHGAIDLVIKPLTATGNAIEIGEDKCTVLIKENIGHMPPLEDPMDMAIEFDKFINK